VLLVLAVGSTLVAQTDTLAPNPDPGASDEVIDPNDAQVDFSNGCLIKFIAFRKDDHSRGLGCRALCRRTRALQEGLDRQQALQRHGERALGAVPEAASTSRMATSYVFCRRTQEDPSIGRMIHGDHAVLHHRG
jgi:hypothetical protein